MSKKITRILIANRGEIAVRVMSTARKMGYTTVAVYSDPDADALHVTQADQAISLGGNTAQESYLSIEKILAACKTSGADAVHPGYGFLSENAEFAKACEEAGITFIGPSPAAIELMGSKRQSKLAMLDAGVPCVPGYQGSDQDNKTLMEQAGEIGFPVMIKASAGGGGRGMRLVDDAKQLESALDTARSESLSAFGSDELILEKAIQAPRHIEIQVFADQHGKTIHLGERDCSIQRRHQKVVEESPSPFVDENLRAEMGGAAVAAAKACQYVGAGTVEFLVDQDRSFYFLEMNTRLQVEHPVTEMVTGNDLVQWQIQVAEGQALPINQDEVSMKGHAVEVRLYAEDPRQQFMPQTGRLLEWNPPENDIRVDSGVSAGQVVSPYYDPMLAKLVAWGETRDQAISKLSNAINRTVLLGIDNNLQFLADVLDKPEFEAGEATTAFLAEHYPNQNYQTLEPGVLTKVLAAVLLYRRPTQHYSYPKVKWSTAVPMAKRMVLSGNDNDFSAMVSDQDGRYSVSIGNQQLSMKLAENTDGELEFSIGTESGKSYFQFAGNTLYLQTGEGHFRFVDQTYQPASTAGKSGNGEVRAAMDGAIVDVSIKEGDTVKTGDVIAVLEAMKMAHQMTAEVDGIAGPVLVEQGQQVKARQLICAIAEAG